MYPNPITAMRAGLLIPEKIIIYTPSKVAESCEKGNSLKICLESLDLQVYIWYKRDGDMTMSAHEENLARMGQWIDRFAPGLDQVAPMLAGDVLTAPHTEITAVIDGPYGLQWRRVVSEGPAQGDYASHVSRPGATVTLLSSEQLILQWEERPELGRKVLKFAGGFTGDPSTARGIIRGYQLVSEVEYGLETPIEALGDEGEALRAHFAKVVQREYGIELRDWPVLLAAAPIGYPAIFITSVMGLIRVPHSEFEEVVADLPQVNSLKRSQEVSGPFVYPVDKICLGDLLGHFGDENSGNLAKLITFKASDLFQA